MEPDDPRLDVIVTHAVGRIAFNLDRLVAEKGWSLRKLSRLSGLNSQSIFNIRNKVANPTIRTMVMLAEAFGVDLMEMVRPISGEEEKE